MSRNLAIERAMRSASPRLVEQLAVTILKSTVVELEAADAISSEDMRTGDAIPFRVACPVLVDGVTVITAGTMTMGVITGVEKYGRYGQPDQITWNVEDVIAVDGTSIPLQLSVRLGGSKAIRTDGREMAAASLMFPGAPLALLFFASQRENTVIRSGQRFRAFVQRDIEVLPSPSEE